jgi:hypothetical protein
MFSFTVCTLDNKYTCNCNACFQLLLCIFKFTVAI